ncbi:MAG: 1,4-dihydroxy-6-naphthoate synthase [Sphingomonadales bacterium]
MKISIGFSPCPNDTYVFDAMVNQLIDTNGIEFEVHIEDVETLNQWALEERLDVTKLSFPALFGAKDSYLLLNSGAALGKGVGPLVVARSPLSSDPAAINGRTVALPGKHTTAHLLFSMAFPEATHKEFMVFSAIEEAVLNGQTELGVLIHENRFTYQAKGLHRVIDLGSYWEDQTQAPLPLGGIAIKKSLAGSLGKPIQALIANSLQYARRHDQLSRFVRTHAQNMEPIVMQQHIDLYVNDYTLSLGENGKKAIRLLQQLYQRLYQGNGQRSTETNNEESTIFLEQDH